MLWKLGNVKAIVIYIYIGHMRTRNYLTVIQIDNWYLTNDTIFFFGKLAINLRNFFVLQKFNIKDVKMAGSQSASSVFDFEKDFFSEHRFHLLIL